MWEQILITVVIELIRRRVSSKDFSKGDFREVVRVTETPPSTLEKLFENSIIRKVAARVLVDLIEGTLKH